MQNRDLSVEVNGTSLLARLEVFKADRSSASLDENATSHVNACAYVNGSRASYNSIITFSELGLSVI